MQASAPRPDPTEPPPAHRAEFTLTEADQLALVDGRKITRVLAAATLVPTGYVAVGSLSFGTAAWPWFWAPIVWAASAALVTLWYRYTIRKAVRDAAAQNPLFFAPITWTFGPAGMAFRGGASEGSLPWSRFVSAELRGGFLRLLTGPETRIAAPIRGITDPERVLADIRGWIAAPPEPPPPPPPPPDALLVEAELTEHDYVQLLAPEPPVPLPHALRQAAEGAVAVGLIAGAFAIGNPPLAYVVLLFAVGATTQRWFAARRWDRALRRIREAPGAYLVGRQQLALAPSGIQAVTPGRGWSWLDGRGVNGWRETDDLFVVTHGGLLLPIPKRGQDAAAIRAALEQYTPRPPAPVGPARPPRAGTPDPFEAPAG